MITGDIKKVLNMSNKHLNIELVENDSDRKVFKTSCMCMLRDHDMVVDVEYDKEIQDLTLTFNHNLVYKDLYGYFGEGFFKRNWRKIKAALKILFNREVTFEGSFMFRGREHITDFCDFIYLLGRDCRRDINDLEQTKHELKKCKRELEKRQ